ncbi:MAG: 16S rRNA (adenine(1518)-N(6)/adenine(1519)-N(6))-dimethyltransferase RsmA [Magnetococcales bacterium]|nr:16S rRNA (adenine(1518)-N(6)/adenine(1519)-N(6))-dimethyltransferase RsmA [Magnetococcales bacterium]
MSGLRPKKGLGQNFLVDDGIAEQIAEAAWAQAQGPLVEIGPGIGSLTLPLLRRAQQVWAVEQDAALLPLLRTRTEGLGQLVVEQGDALLVDFRQWAERLGRPLTIVANLPYHVSTPILFHLLAQGAAVGAMILMFQKEVAERIAAPPGGKTYGILSVHSQLWMAVEPLFAVPPKAFYPSPKVDSSVIRLVRRAAPLAQVDDPDFFRLVVRAAFGQRRKTLLNALKVIDPSPEAWLSRADIDPQRRGETLAVVEFVRLANVR